ncbi:hypothetical protein Tco_1228883 [Tanacetum coccineum]
MSDSEHSTVTYTSVSILVEDDSDMGSPGVDGPPSLDYVPGPEEPKQAPPSPVYLPYVPEPVYPKYIPPEDDVFLAEEQLLPAITSPTTDSPGYIPERDDDDDDDDDDDEEEEEHLAPADYTVVALPAVDHVLSEEETEPFETDECATTPPSPLIPYSSPLPQIPSPPLPIPSPPPNSPTHIEVPESCLPLRKKMSFAAPIPNHEVGESSAAGAARQDGPAVVREDPYSVARGDFYRFVDRVDFAPRRLMSRELDYDYTVSWDDLVGAIEEIASTTLEGVNQRVTNLSTTVCSSSFSSNDREREARMAREAWGLSMDASDYARSDVMSLRTTIVGQRALILELQSADHRRQGTQMAEFQSLLSIMGYSQLADCIDLLFCLATQYRSFVQKMAPKRRTTRLNPGATPTPVTDTHTTTSVTNAQLQAMIDEGVTADMQARDATRNGDDSHTSGTGARRPVQVARECTYPDFLKCQPLNFKGTEGVVGLTQWFEKMESVYSISNCTVACQVKFATCTLQGNALTWWNSHVKTTTPEAAHAMP